MKSQVTIIGGGLAGWASASVFSENGYEVDIYDKQSQNFGSQQISPNGWLALAKLIDIKKIKPFFEPFNNIQIKYMDSNQKVELLSNYNVDNKTIKYGSIERESIVNLLKENALKNKSITTYNSHIEHIVSNDETNEIIDDNGNIFVAKSIIGADSINGVSRKFVIGSDTESKQKKIFRAFSFKTSSYQLARNSLQLIITSTGHFVIYPTIIDKKNATNYIFVPADGKSTPPIIHDKILSYLIPYDIIWDTTFSTTTNEENNVIHRNGVFLVGDASIATPPHIAQAGNQTLEDAAFIKKCLQENNDFKQMISMFIKQRYIKRNIISKKSKSIGKILSAQKFMGYLRNLSLKSYGNEILETILNPIWTSDTNE
jgi:2-polyprenyl-6-methoxyphenol hydroxylase-like FAD-dependent oxidoreductase